MFDSTDVRFEARTRRHAPGNADEVRETSTRVFYMRVCGPRSSEVGPSNRRLLKACLACLAVAVGVPVAAMAKSDPAAHGPGASLPKTAKAVKAGPAKRIGGRPRKATGGGKPGKATGGGKPGKATGGGKPGKGAGKASGSAMSSKASAGGKASTGSGTAKAGTGKHPAGG